VADPDIPALVARLERHMNQLRDRPINAERAESFSVLEAAAAALSRLTRERDAFKEAWQTCAQNFAGAHNALATALRERDEALAREQADKDAWAIYLKVGETPLDRLAREIADNHAVCAVLAHRTAQRDEAREALAEVKGMGAWRKWDE
jgi:hypothetical protein